MPVARSAKTRLSTRRGVALVPGFHTGAITRQVNGPSPSGVSAVFLGIQFPPKTESRKNRGARTAALSRRLTVANRASKSVVMDADGFERVFVCVFFLSFSLSRHFTTRLSRITANRSEATGHSTHRRSGFIFCPQANASDGDDRDGRKLAKNFVENHDHKEITTLFPCFLPVKILFQLASTCQLAVCFCTRSSSSFGRGAAVSGALRFSVCQPGRSWPVVGLPALARPVFALPSFHRNSGKCVFVCIGAFEERPGMNVLQKQNGQKTTTTPKQRE